MKVHLFEDKLWHEIPEDFKLKNQKSIFICKGRVFGYHLFYLDKEEENIGTLYKLKDALKLANNYE